MTDSPSLRQGSIFRIKTKQGLEVEGCVYLVYKRANLVIIETKKTNQTKDITFISLDQISNSKFIRDDPNHSIESIQADPGLIERKEKENIHKRYEQSTRVGRGVTPLAQSIFDHLFRVLPGRNKVAWDKKVIRLCGNQFYLQEPYRSIELARNATQTQEYAWATKQLSAFWKNHDKQAAAAAVANDETSV